MKYIIYALMLFVVLFSIFLVLDWIEITPRGYVVYEAFIQFLLQVYKFLLALLFDLYEKFKTLV